MKKRILALLLCVQMMLSNLSPAAPGILAWAEEGGESAPENGSNVTVESIFPESQLTWKSFRDYLLDQARNAWNYPGMYVGYEVTFLSCWESFFCKANVEGNSPMQSVLLSDESKTTGNVLNPEDLKLVIVDYYYDESTTDLWYKVKAAEGYTLPEVLEKNPYVLHINCDNLEAGLFDQEPPTFLIGPVKGIFKNSSGSVYFKKQNVVASAMDAVDVTKLPTVFDVGVTYTMDTKGQYAKVVWGDLDLGDLAAEYTTYTYVDNNDVILIPVEASVAYDQLMNAEDTYEYYEVLGKLTDSVLAQLSDKHKAQLDVCIESLAAQEQVKYETVVGIGTTNVPVSVVGKLPENVSLQVGVVSADTVIAEGFDVESAEDIIVALDIKLINQLDGTEWQPKEGRRVAVSIGVGALGYEDGTILSLQHKHGEHIETFDVFVVENGSVTLHTGGFSIYMVNPPKGTTAIGGTLESGATITMEVGETRTYYNNRNNYTVGTWAVTDKSGAVQYTVASNTTIGNGGMKVPWITIDALKEASGDSQVELTFNYYYNNRSYSETYYLNIVAPKADKGKYKLYLKDDVNSTGRIIATLVDENGKEVEGGLDGAAFEWLRDDDYYINPRAYDVDYKAVNIAVDHAGLVEARMNDAKTGYEPTTYTCNVILANGDKVTADYTVYYQSEFINSSFEFPNAPQNYTFFPNGWAELYWKTTAPGTGANISKDIEYGFPQSSGTGWGVPEAASGKQFAELNAEAYGALYQDIISVPGEDISWHFEHAPRQNQNWGNNTRFSNAMFIVIGATETAQELNHADLEALGAAAKASPDADADFTNGLKPVVVTYTKDDTVGEYYVWYHDAKEVPTGNNNAYGGEDKGWTQLEGSYTVPEGQYRTRLFFVTDKLPYSNSPNAGNIIDVAKVGQYKTYLIEYYLGRVDANNEVVMEYYQDKKESGEALIYSSVKLETLPELMTVKHQYLYKVLINGNNAPYNIRYAGDASLYIEKYPRAENFTKPADSPNNYDDYDIVMQVYLRDVVVVVQKEIIFPAALTIEQKLSIIEDLKNTEGGYKAEFQTTVLDGGAYTFDVTGSALITERDPAGKYTGYYSMVERPEVDYTYRLQELDPTPIPGLKLVKKTYKATMYEKGVAQKPYYSYSDSGKDYIDFKMDQKKEIHFADIYVENIYEEKETKIYYKAVGNGKVRRQDQENLEDFVDTPSETLAFYSGKSIGANVHPGNGATFVGWYKDPACREQDRVTAADGVVSADGSFKPNANIINADEVTFYAKFETGSIVINRTGANAHQSFVYHITSKGENGKPLDMYVTLQCDATGAGSVTVLEVPLGQTYTVTECEDWSWRHTGETKSDTNGDKKMKLEFTFNSGKKTKWLSGLAELCKNVFGSG